MAMAMKAMEEPSVAVEKGCVELGEGDEFDKSLARAHLLLQAALPLGLAEEIAAAAGDGDTGHPWHRHHTAGTEQGLAAVSPQPCWLSGGADLSSLLLPAVFRANDLSIHLFGGDKSLRASLPLFPSAASAGRSRRVWRVPACGSRDDGVF